MVRFESYWQSEWHFLLKAPWKLPIRHVLFSLASSSSQTTKHNNNYAKKRTKATPRSITRWAPLVAIGAKSLTDGYAASCRGHLLLAKKARSTIVESLTRRVVDHLVQRTYWCPISLFKSSLIYIPKSFLFSFAQFSEYVQEFPLCLIHLCTHTQRD